MILQFHQRTFDFLKQQPTVSPARRESLIALEQFLKVKLPETVNEWFSLSGSNELIRLNADKVLPVEAFCLSPNPLFNDLRWQSPKVDADKIVPWRVDPQSWLTDNLLTIVVENQGVCEWAVDLNGQPDPPVWTRWNESDARWLPCSVSFSEFVFARVWDTQVYSSVPSIRSWTHKLSFSVLGDLEQRFDFVLMNQPHPGYRCYRFENDLKRIRICETRQGVEWYFCSPDRDSLVKLINAIRSLKDVFAELTAHDSSIDA